MSHIRLELHTHTKDREAVMVKIKLPDLSSPSVSTHHLLVGCQRREEEERGVRWGEG